MSRAARAIDLRCIAERLSRGRPLVSGLLCCPPAIGRASGAVALRRWFFGDGSFTGSRRLQERRFVVEGGGRDVVEHDPAAALPPLRA